MPRALWLLIWLQLSGWLRYVFLNLTTVKGATLALLGLAVFIPWLLGALLAPARSGMDPAQLRTFAPPALLAYCLLNVLVAAPDSSLYFTPAEVGMLFAAPFSRRQLLAYRLTTTALVGLPATVLLAAVMRPHAGSFLSALVGSALVFAFINLFAVAVRLSVASIGVQLFRWGRRIVLAIAVFIGLAFLVASRFGAASELSAKRIEDLSQSAAWKIATLPFSWFVETFLARSAWPDLAAFASFCLLINLLLLAIVFGLDSLSLESAAAASARLYDRIQRLRGKQAIAETEPRGDYRFSIPSLPRLGGVGPIVWRQLTIAVRNPIRLAVLALPFAVFLLGPLVTSRQDAQRSESLLPLLGMGTIWLTFFLTALVPFDFRGDIDRLAVLKTLPLAAWRLTLGQLAAPVLLVSSMQLLILAALPLIEPGAAGMAATAAIFVLPSNFLLFAVENLLFLLFPVRLTAANPGDFQAIGKNVLFMTARMLTLFAAAAAAAAAGFLAYAISGSQRGGWAIACLVLIGAGVCLVPLIALAFRAFDVGRDTPA